MMLCAQVRKWQATGIWRVACPRVATEMTHTHRKTHVLYYYNDPANFTFMHIHQQKFIQLPAAPTFLFMRYNSMLSCNFDCAVWLHHNKRAQASLKKKENTPFLFRQLQFFLRILPSKVKITCYRNLSWFSRTALKDNTIFSDAFMLRWRVVVVIFCKNPWCCWIQTFWVQRCKHLFAHWPFLLMLLLLLRYHTQML